MFLVTRATETQKGRTGPDGQTEDGRSRHDCWVWSKFPRKRLSLEAHRHLCDFVRSLFSDLSSQQYRNSWTEPGDVFTMKTWQQMFTWSSSRCGLFFSLPPHSGVSSPSSVLLAISAFIFFPSWLRSFSLLSVVSSFHFMLSSSPPALTQTLPKNNPSLHIRPYPFTLITSLFSWTEWTVCDGSGRASHVINMEIMAELCVGQSGLGWRIGCFVRWFPQSGYLTNDSGSNSVCLSFGREVNYSHL